MIGAGTFPHREEILRPGDVRNPPPSDLHQPFDGQLRTLLVVRPEGDAVLRPLGERIDHRHMQIRQIDRQAPVQAFSRRDDAVDLFVQHRIDMDLGERRIVFNGAQEDRNAVIDECVRDTRHDRQRETAVSVVRQQPDGEAALAEKTSRQRIRPISDFGGDPFHPFARFRPHPAGIIESFRRRRDAHRGSRRHLVDGDPASFSSRYVQNILLLK